MKFFIVALALMAMFSTASGTTQIPDTTTVSTETGFTEVAGGWCSGPFHDTGSKDAGTVSTIEECYEKCSQIDNYNVVGIEFYGSSCYCQDGCLCWNEDSDSTSWVSNAVTVPTVSCDNYIEPGSFIVEITSYTDDTCQSRDSWTKEGLFFDLCYDWDRYTCNADNTITITEYSSDSDCQGTTTNTTVSNGGCVELSWYGHSKITWSGDCSSGDGSDVQALSIALLFALCLMFEF